MATKTRAPKLPSFPFLGAGDAHYFEWFEMFVWFAEPVPKTKRAAIVKMAPKLCQLDAQWPSGELLWASTGDQFIHQHLVDEYGDAKAKKRMAAFAKRVEDDGDPWGGDSDEMLAMGNEEQTFNQDIEAWLVALNDKFPILFAARREDGEAGGTKLSAWHKASVKQWSDVEPRVHVHLASRPLKKDDLRVAPIAIAAQYVGLSKVSSKTRAVAKRDDQ